MTQTADGEESEADFKLIDWQVSRYTTPVLDLSYFLVCCADQEACKGFKELLDFYYEALMEEIGYLLGDKQDGAQLFPRTVFDQHCRDYMKFGMGTYRQNMLSGSCPVNMYVNLCLL